MCSLSSRAFSSFLKFYEAERTTTSDAHNIFSTISWRNFKSNAQTLLKSASPSQFFRASGKMVFYLSAFFVFGIFLAEHNSNANINKGAFAEPMKAHSGHLGSTSVATTRNCTVSNFLVFLVVCTASISKQISKALAGRDSKEENWSTVDPLSD